MFMPANAISLSADSFPASGRFCLFPLSRPSYGGSVPKTQVSLFVDTRWSYAEVNAAVENLQAASSSTSLFSGTSTPSPSGAFDGGRAGAALTSVSSSLAGAAASLSAVASLQAIAGGHAEAEAASASLAFLLVEAALSASSAAAAVELRLAARSSSLQAVATLLFAGVAKLALLGSVAGGPSLGKTLSGSLWLLASQAGSLSPGVLGNIPGELASPPTAGISLLAALAAVGFDPVALPSGASPSDFVALFPAAPVGLGSSSFPSVGDGIVALEAAAATAVAAIVALSQQQLAASVPQPSSSQSPAAAPLPGTGPRAQGLVFIDGLPPLALQSSAPYLVSSSQLAAEALASVSAATSGLQPGISTPGSLGASGGVTASLAAAMAAALAVGPPFVGDLRDAGLPAVWAAAGQMGDPTDLKGPASLLASLLTGDGSFETALAGALGTAADAVLSDGAIPSPTSLEAILDVLECRRAVYTSAASAAYAASRLSEFRLHRLLGAASLFASGGMLLPPDLNLLGVPQ